jgi:riboflavin kinase/FMN adenylyltransferase
MLPFNGAGQPEPRRLHSGCADLGLGAKYVLVGDDFRFGAKRAGDYAMLDAAGQALGFDVARMNSYEVHGLRVSSTAVREALAAGDMQQAAKLLGHPYRISGHVVHGRKLGRKLAESQSGAEDGFRTLNLRFDHWKPAASGIFAVLVHGLTDAAARRGQPGRAPLAGPERRQRRPGAAGDPLFRLARPAGWRRCLR